MAAHRGALDARDEHRAPRKDDLHLIGRHPGKIDDDLDLLARLDDVCRGMAFTRRGVGLALGIEQIEEAPEVLSHFPSFQVDARHGVDCTASILGGERASSRGGRMARTGCG